MNDRISPSLPFDEALQWYLQDLATMPVLSSQAEHDLLQQLAADPHSNEADQVRTCLVEGNLRLVIPLARRFEPFGLELLDLVQEGNLALMNAAQHIDPQRHSSFKPFARQQICRALSRLVSAHQRARHLVEADSEPIRPLRAPVLKALAHNAIDEQALVFDLPEERLVSLDALLEACDTDAGPTDEHSSAPLSASEETSPDECKATIAEALQALTETERLVLRHRSLLDTFHTLAEVGKALRITPERVRQLEERACQKLRRPRLANKLRPLL